MEPCVIGKTRWISERVAQAANWTTLANELRHDNNVMETGPRINNKKHLRDTISGILVLGTALLLSACANIQMNAGDDSESAQAEVTAQAPATVAQTSASDVDDLVDNRIHFYQEVHLHAQPGSPVWQALAEHEAKATQDFSPWTEKPSLVYADETYSPLFPVVVEAMPEPELDAIDDADAPVDEATNAFLQLDNSESTLFESLQLDNPEDTPTDTVPEVAGFEDYSTPDDIWDRIRSGFRLSDHDHPRLKPQIDWYARNQAYLNRVVERARPFLYDIVEEVARNDMPMEVALLPVVESAYQAFAYSPGRAAGIWQFIPSTGRLYGLKQNWWYDGRRDVPAATRAAVKYLQRLNKVFDGDWLLALAAYNSGEGRVLSAMRKNRKRGKPTDFWSLDLPNETRGYVPKLLAISNIVEHHLEHGITLGSIPDEPYLTQVNVGSQIDLALVSELSGLSLETVYRLNPAFNRWATDPNGPHVISLPLTKAEDFKQALAKVDRKQRIRWQRHKIKEGETLGHIANKYQTTVRMLQEVNNIRGKMIRAGHSITIPVATKSLNHYLSEDQRRLALQQTERNGIKIKHQVRKGDTFWDLSQRYGVSVRKIASWNGMAPIDALMPGQQLVIWTRKPQAARQNMGLPAGISRQQRLQYRVRKGDSLARIAQRFNVTVSNLRNWNSLPKGKYLQPGQKLTVYIDITKQS